MKKNLNFSILASLLLCSTSCYTIKDQNIEWTYLTEFHYIMMEDGYGHKDVIDTNFDDSKAQVCFFQHKGALIEYNYRADKPLFLVVHQQSSNELYSYLVSLRTHPTHPPNNLKFSRSVQKIINEVVKTPKKYQI